MRVTLIAPPGISVCILTCNRDALLALLLAALQKQIQPQDEIIILDTGGAESTKAVVENAGIPQSHYHTFIQPHFNFAAARNELLRLAARDAIAFIDDDAIPLPGWLEEIRAKLCQHEAVGGATVARGGLPAWWDPAINWTAGLSPPGTILGQPGFYPDTCNMAARTALWREHPFEQVSRDGRALYATGREDADWWMQRRLEGRNVVINWRQAVSHQVHSDRLTLKYIKQRARNDGLSSWLRRPSLRAATDIPWDLAHIAAVVAKKSLRNPIDQRSRLVDSIWLNRQWGKFMAVWDAPRDQRPRRREQACQLARAAAFQTKIHVAHTAFSLQKKLQKPATFPPELPRQIFISADCFLGDSVLLRRHIYLLAQTFPDAKILVSCRYTRLFQGLADNIQALPTREAAAAIRSGQFNPDAAIVPYFPFGDVALWRDKLASIGATFNCDVGFPGRRDYTCAQLQIPKSMELHEHENLARLFRLWPSDSELFSPLPPPHISNAEHEKWIAYLAEHGITGNYIAVQFGSGHPSKSWPAESWIEFLKLFVPKAGLPIIIMGGDDWRAAADDTISKLSGLDIPVLNHCGAPFDEMMPGIAGAALFIGGCSGPRHLAMALGVPTFTLYAASEPIRWGAVVDHNLHGYITALPQKLSGMELQEVPDDHRIKLLHPEHVTSAALKHWEHLKTPITQTNPSDLSHLSDA